MVQNFLVFEEEYYSRYYPSFLYIRLVGSVRYGIFFRIKLPCQRYLSLRCRFDFSELRLRVFGELFACYTSVLGALFDEFRLDGVQFGELVRTVYIARQVVVYQVDIDSI